MTGMPAARAAPSRGQLRRAIGRDRPKGGPATIIIRPLYPQLLTKLQPSIETVKKCQQETICDEVDFRRKSIISVRRSEYGTSELSRPDYTVVGEV